MPPNQAELMYDAVKARGLPCTLKIYEGEQHGFRRPMANRGGTPGHPGWLSKHRFKTPKVAVFD